MATHSSILAWRIPWAEEPGGLQSTGSQRVGHDLATKAAPGLLGGSEENPCKAPEAVPSTGCVLQTLSGVQLFVTPWTIQSLKLSRPEYWSG